jgi:uncharacterized membrane protein
MNRIITFVVSLLTLVWLDYVWLWVVIQSKIQKRLGPLMREWILYWPAIAFYVLYTWAILYFAILPAVQQNSRRVAVLNWAILWFTAYMTYDMTNRATLKWWPVEMVVRDIVWWAVVTAVVAFVGFFAFNKWAI